MRPRASSSRAATRSSPAGHSPSCCNDRVTVGASCTITRLRIRSDRDTSARRHATAAAAARRLQQAAPTKRPRRRPRGRDADRWGGRRAETGRVDHHPQRPHRSGRAHERNPHSRKRRARQSGGQDGDPRVDRFARARRALGGAALHRVGRHHRPRPARRHGYQGVVMPVDYLKIYTKITPALLRPLMDEAVKLRLPVAAHLGKTDALTAARAGVVSIEHVAGVVQAATGNPMYAAAHNTFLSGWTTEEKGWASLDSSAVARTARALAQTKVAIVPTLIVHDMLSRLDNPILLTRPGMEDVPDNAESVRSVPGLLRRTGWRSSDFDAFRRSRKRQDQFVREYRRAGGVIAAGSDAANQLLIPGYSLHEEMSLL